MSIWQVKSSGKIVKNIFQKGIIWSLKYFQGQAFCCFQILLFVREREITKWIANNPHSILRRFILRSCKYAPMTNINCEWHEANLSWRSESGFLGMPPVTDIGNASLFPIDLFNSSIYQLDITNWILFCFYLPNPFIAQIYVCYESKLFLPSY